MSIALSDPQFEKVTSPSAFHRWAARLILDERDVPFVRLMVVSTVVMFPLALLLYAKFHWLLALGYIAVNFFVFVDRYILMLHNTSHRVLFKPKWRFLNHYIPWVLGPIFGETPGSYFAHHVGMHHPENNLPEDLSSTMRFERDNFWHFCRYLFRFLFLGIFELNAYLFRKKRGKIARRFIVGELSFYALVAALMFVNAPATVVVLVVPVIAIRSLMMCGNWGQHAFIDASQPANCYLNSITCINTRYNRRCFNDGYHIGHHIKGNRHWTEMPMDFETNLALYAKEGAIVFEGIDFFQVWFLLMGRRYEKLASHYVSIDGRKPSRNEIVKLLHERTRPIAPALTLPCA